MVRQTPRRKWTKAEEALLKAFMEQNVPAPLVAERLGRTEASIRQRATRLKLSWKQITVVKPVSNAPAPVGVVKTPPGFIGKWIGSLIGVEWRA